MAIKPIPLSSNRSSFESQAATRFAAEGKIQDVFQANISIPLFDGARNFHSLFPLFASRHGGEHHENPHHAREDPHHSEREWGERSEIERRHPTNPERTLIEIREHIREAEETLERVMSSGADELHEAAFMNQMHEPFFILENYTKSEEGESALNRLKDSVALSLSQIPDFEAQLARFTESILQVSDQRATLYAYEEIQKALQNLPNLQPFAVQFAEVFRALAPVDVWTLFNQEHREGRLEWMILDCHFLKMLYGPSVFIDWESPQQKLDLIGSCLEEYNRLENTLADLVRLIPDIVRDYPLPVQAEILQLTLQAILSQESAIKVTYENSYPLYRIENPRVPEEVRNQALSDEEKMDADPECWEALVPSRGDIFQSRLHGIVEMTQNPADNAIAISKQILTTILQTRLERRRLGERNQETYHVVAYATFKDGPNTQSIIGTTYEAQVRTIDVAFWTHSVLVQRLDASELAHFEHLHAEMLVVRTLGLAFFREQVERREWPDLSQIVQSFGISKGPCPRCAEVLQRVGIGIHQEPTGPTPHWDHPFGWDDPEPTGRNARLNLIPNFLTPISYQENALFAAVKAGDNKKVQELVGSGFDLNAPGETQFTPLEVALAYLQDSTALFLLGLGADPFGVDPFGQTTLHYSARYLMPETYFSMLLLKFVPEYLNAQDTVLGYSALHWLALHGQLVMAQRLVRLGIDLNQRDINGRTPLHLAVQNADQKMAQLLLFYGADLNVPDDENHTPLHVIIEMGLASTLLCALELETPQVDLAGSQKYAKSCNQKFISQLLSAFR